MRGVVADLTAKQRERLQEALDEANESIREEHDPDRRLLVERLLGRGRMRRWLIKVLAASMAAIPVGIGEHVGAWATTQVLPVEAAQAAVLPPADPRQPARDVRLDASRWTEDERDPLHDPLADDEGSSTQVQTVMSPEFWKELMPATHNRQAWEGFLSLLDSTRVVVSNEDYSALSSDADAAQTDPDQVYAAPLTEAYLAELRRHLQDLGTGEPH